MTSVVTMQAILGAVFSLVLASGASSLATAAPLKDGQQRQVTTQLRLAKGAEQAKDPVKAFLYLREALRLEQLWSGNTLGPDSEASREMERFSSDLVRRNDDALVRVLHSQTVPLADKLGLIRLLEEEVILRYPGARNDTLLQDYDE